MPKLKRLIFPLIAVILAIGLCSCTVKVEPNIVSGDTTAITEEIPTDTSPVKIKGIYVKKGDAAEALAKSVNDTKPDVVGFIGAGEQLCADAAALLSDYTRVFDAPIFVLTDGFSANGCGSTESEAVMSNSTTVTRISDGFEFSVAFADIGAVDETYESLIASEQFALDFADDENLVLIARFGDEDGGEVLWYLDRNAAPAIDGGTNICAFAGSALEASAEYSDTAAVVTVSRRTGEVEAVSGRQYIKGAMNYENLRQFAYHNGELIEGEVKGVVIYFKGLGDQTVYETDGYYAKHFAADGILFVIPYVDVLGWMSNKSVVYADQVLEVLYSHFSLPEDTPVVSTGESMGGLSGIVYTRYTKFNPIACVTNCPVCDLFDSYDQSYPTTVYNAMLDSGYEDLDFALRDRSPYYLAPELPDIPYVIYQSGGDRIVLPTVHAEPFLAKMNALGYTTEYHVVPDRGHVDLGAEEADFYALMGQFIKDYPKN